MKSIEPTEKDIIELASRLFGYPVDVVDYYCKIYKIDINKLSLADYNTSTLEKLMIIDRYTKIKKLLNKCK